MHFTRGQLEEWPDLIGGLALQFNVCVCVCARLNYGLSSQLDLSQPQSLSLNTV